MEVVLEAKKETEVKRLEELEQEAGKQILDDIKKYLQSLGKQFTLESDPLESLPKKKGMSKGSIVRQSQVFSLVRQSRCTGSFKNVNQSVNKLGSMTSRFATPSQRRFQDRESFAQVAFGGSKPKASLR